MREDVAYTHTHTHFTIRTHHPGRLDDSASLVKRCLFVFDRARHPLFDMCVPSHCRLSYSVEENRGFFSALFRHMQVCVCVCVCVCVGKIICVWLYVYTSVSVFVLMRACVLMHARGHVCKFVCVCLPDSMYVSLYVCAHTTIPTPLSLHRWWA